MDPSLPRSANDPLTPFSAALADRYRVEREIGAGGMATVYLARDLRHNRQVAVKVLRPELGAVLGAERFLAEIQVTANLQHPNLLPLFDSGEANGLLYYVMPYVEGESLRARLMREKQLPVDEAVRIAAAVGSALDYAHSHGVIHRDLKPDNILMHAGQPVLADFGIALAVANAGGARITQTGLSLGTPQYMSPEQATGDRVIDGRTDIYSLGAVLYEMLTGDPPHTGSTAQAIIARVLTDKPRTVRSTRETVPASVEAAVERALAKLPADRFSTAREFVEALTGWRSSALTSGTAVPRSSDFSLSISIPKEKLAQGARWAALAALVGVAAWGWLRPAASPQRITRFQLTISDSMRLRAELAGQNLTISPDGSQIVFLGGQATDMLYLRRLSDLVAQPIRGTDAARQAKFSPDGRWLAFLAGGRLQKIPMPGGPAVTITDSGGTFSWGDKDVIVYTARSGLWRVGAGGGVATLLAQRDSAKGETSFNWPFVLPGSKAALFDITIDNDNAGAELAVVSLKDGKVTKLGVLGRNPRYVKPGFIVFGRLDGTIVAAPFDLKRLRVTGPAVTLIDGVYIKSGGASEFGVADDGTLFYVEGISDGELVLADRSGNVIRSLVPGVRTYQSPRFSPTSGRIAFSLAERSSFQRTDIWVYNDLTKTASRLTNDGKSSRPEWMADGERVAWMNSDSGRHARWQKWDGTGRPEQFLTNVPRPAVVHPSPAGNGFAITTSNNNIDVVDADKPSVVRSLVATPAQDGGARISPDGKWVVYYSDESGRREVYVTSFAGGGGRHQISNEGGAEPVWSRDGRTIYYRNAGRIHAATIVTQPAFVVTSRTALMTDLFRQTGNIANFDVSPDGKTFLVLTRGDGRERVVVVTNWRQELIERMQLATQTAR